MIEQRYDYLLKVLSKLMTGFNEVLLSHKEGAAIASSYYMSIFITDGKEAIKFHLDEKPKQVSKFSPKLVCLDDIIFDENGKAINLDTKSKIIFYVKYEDFINNVEKYWRIIQKTELYDTYITKTIIGVTRKNFSLGPYENMSRWATDVILSTFKYWKEITIDDFMTMRVSSAPIGVASIYDQFLRGNSKYPKVLLDVYTSEMYRRNLLIIKDGDLSKVAAMLGQLEVFNLNNVKKWFIPFFEKFLSQLKNGEVAGSNDILNNIYKSVLLMGGASVFNNRAVDEIFSIVESESYLNEDVIEKMKPVVVVFNNNPWIAETKILVYKQDTKRKFYLTIDGSNVSSLYALIFNFLSLFPEFSKINGYQLIQPQGAGFDRLKGNLSGKKGVILFTEKGFNQELLIEQMLMVLTVLNKTSTVEDLKEVNALDRLFSGELKEISRVHLLKLNLDKTLNQGVNSCEDKDDILVNGTEYVDLIKI